MDGIVTISTASHLFKSYALAESLNRFGYQLHILLVDGDRNTIPPPNIRITHINQLRKEAEKAVKKFRNQPDKLRWTLKPVFVSYLLESGYERVIYVDNDIFFYSSPGFLFEELKSASFLLTPHFYKANPDKEQNWLEANYRVGLYNAGFFGANKDALSILYWWEKCCLYAVKKAYWRGLYDDQKYLDLVPIIFENINIIKHRGCNFAGWNCDGVSITSTGKEHLFINDHPLVFIHFAQLSMERFSRNESPVFPFYQLYLNTLQRYHPDFRFKSKKRNIASLSTYFYYLRWKFIRLFEN